MSFDYFTDRISFFAGGVGSDRLRYALVPLMANEDCNQCGDLSGRIKDGMLCAGACWINTRDSCQVLKSFYLQIHKYKAWLSETLVQMRVLKSRF